MKLTVLTTALVLIGGAAQAGPCTTASMSKQDAGSGPTTGSASQTENRAAAKETPQHPPTSAMNQAASSTATSAQDVQRQTEGKPTAAQQAQGATPADQGC
jgi:hypothetical protein